MSDKAKSLTALIAGTLSSVCLAGGTALGTGATWHDLGQPVPVLLMVGSAATSVMLWVVKGYRALVEKEGT